MPTGIPTIGIEGKSIYSCIRYSGFHNHDGYPYSHGKQVMRRLWEKTWGIIPEGFELAHLCDNRACINLGHIYLASHAENMADRYLHKGLVAPITVNRQLYDSLRYYRKKRVR